MKRLSILLFLVAWTGVHPYAAEAQTDAPETYDLILRGVSMQEALDRLVDLTQIDLIYDTELIQGLEVYCSTREAQPEDLLRCITSSGELDFYQLSSGTYVVIESALLAPQFGSLIGTVIDDRTGEPLPYANVFIADASLGTSTNQAGMFALPQLLPGRHRLVATYVGYEPAVQQVWIDPSGQSLGRFRLRQRTLEGNPVIVSGSRADPRSWFMGLSELRQRQVNQLLSQPGISPIRRVQSLNGISSGIPEADLHIQGGENGEHSFTLDGAPVYHPVSLGRLSSAFSPMGIGRITVHKAGFGPEMGSQMSGVVAAEHRLPESTSDRIAFSIDPMSINGRIAGRIPTSTGHLSAMLSGRSSIWGQYRHPVIEQTLSDWTLVDPGLMAITSGSIPLESVVTPERIQTTLGFDDIHAALEWAPSPFHRLMVSAYRGSNRVNADVLAVASEMGSDVSRVAVAVDDYDWTNSTLQARYDWLAGARYSGFTQATYSNHGMGRQYLWASTDPLSNASLDVVGAETSLRSTFQSGEPAPDENMIQDMTLRSVANVSFSSRTSLSAGAEVNLLSSQFDLSSAFLRRLAFNHQTWRTSLWSDFDLDVTPSLNVSIGQRLTYLPSRTSTYFEPRVSVNVDAGMTPLGALALRFSGGLYRQFVNEFSLSNVGASSAVPSIRFWLPVDETVAPPRATHATADIILRPARGLRVSVENYYKNQTHLLAVDYGLLVDASLAGSTRQSDFVGNANGFSYGSSTRVEYDTDVVAVDASYTLTKSRRTVPSRFDGRKVPVPWEQPHRIQLGARLSILDNLVVQIRSTNIWGRTWGFRRAYYDYVSAHTDGDHSGHSLTDPGSDTLPSLHFVDAGLDYRLAAGPVGVIFRAEATNILNLRNVLDQSILRPGGEVVIQERYFPGIMPSFGVKIEV